MAEGRPGRLTPSGVNFESGETLFRQIPVVFPANQRRIWLNLCWACLIPIAIFGTLILVVHSGSGSFPPFLATVVLLLFPTILAVIFGVGAVVRRFSHPFELVTITSRRLLVEHLGWGSYPTGCMLRDIEDVRFLPRKRMPAGEDWLHILPTGSAARMQGGGDSIFRRAPGFYIPALPSDLARDLRETILERARVAREEARFRG